MIVEQVTGPSTFHGEGPVWSEAWGGLRWVDTYAGDVLRLAAPGVVERWHVADMVTSIRPSATGGVVLSSERAILLADRPDGDARELVHLIDGPGQRMNDGACDPLGRFWCGTIDHTGSGAGVLHRIDPAGSAEVVVDGVQVSNGIDWSPDGRTMYYSDTGTGRVDAFRVAADGSLGARRAFVAIPADRGAPDGLTVDAEGGVWIALWGGSGVDRYDPDGGLVETVRLPTRQVTACTFGGDDLDELYITTSREGDADPHPAAGSLFRVRPGVRGRPVTPFAG